MKNPPKVDRVWLWVYYEKIPIYPIFYLLKGDYTSWDLGVTNGLMGLGLMGLGFQGLRVWGLADPTIGLGHPLMKSYEGFDGFDKGM